MQESRTRLVPAPGAQQTRIGALNAVREIAPRAGPGLPTRIRAWLVALPVRRKVVGGAAALVAVSCVAALALRSGSGSSCPSVVALDDDVRSYSFGHLDAQVE